MALRGIQEFISRDVNNIARVEETMKERVAKVTCRQLMPHLKSRQCAVFRLIYKITCTGKQASWLDDHFNPAAR